MNERRGIQVSSQRPVVRGQACWGGEGGQGSVGKVFYFLPRVNLQFKSNRSETKQNKHITLLFNGQSSKLRVLQITIVSAIEFSSL